LHNGRCVDVTSNNDPDVHFEDLNEYKCFCNAMYSGKNCEVPFPACTSAPCYHNGTCIDGITHPDFNFDETGYHCLCSPGFEGKNCEKQYTFASPEEEEQILHPTEPPDFEPLTPTPMVVYERPPRTTPPVGKVDKANPAVVIVKHKDYNRNRFADEKVNAPLRIPINEQAPRNTAIEDHLAQKAKEAAEQKVVSSKDEVLSADRDLSQSTVVRVAPDNGAPGGAVSIVNQVPKQAQSDTAAARLVSLLPDTASVPGAMSNTAQAYGNARSDVMQQYAASENSQPGKAMTYEGYRYYGYPNYGMSQNAQTRSLQSKVDWPSVYNQLLKRKQSYGT